MDKSKMDFLVYCLERYRYAKGLTGSEAAALFARYNLYDYLAEYYESLHTLGEKYIIADIERQLA